MQKIFLALLPGLYMVLASSCGPRALPDILPGDWEVVEAHTVMGGVNPAVLVEADRQLIGSSYHFDTTGLLSMHSLDGDYTGTWELLPGDTIIYLQYVPAHGGDTLDYPVFVEKRERKTMRWRQEYSDGSTTMVLRKYR